MFAGRKHWRAIPRPVRQELYLEVLDLLSQSRQARLFGVAIHREAISPNDPIEYAFEQLINRFDRFLGRLHKKGDTQRGLVILDESSYETSLQGLAKEFGRTGHRWGKLYNIGEVPLFVNSRATRMIQIADMIAYALRRYYENGEARYLDRIAHLFDGEGGARHGLVHFRPTGTPCNCRACR
ncbi:MAG: DUF3800 domain-containing protein [Alphaproteobacteria bacterium]|nr:DUF3800 domain-containing protein [Alphaproteobacteria bacterium]